MRQLSEKDTVRLLALAIKYIKRRTKDWDELMEFVQKFDQSKHLVGQGKLYRTRFSRGWANEENIMSKEKRTAQTSTATVVRRDAELLDFLQNLADRSEVKLKRDGTYEVIYGGKIHKGITIAEAINNCMDGKSF